MPRDAHRFSAVIDLPEPYDAPRLFDFLATRAIPGVETVDSTTGGMSYARSLRLAGGPASMHLRQDGSRAVVSGLLSDKRDRASAISSATRILDLASDPAAVDAALARRQPLQRLVAERPGIRVPGAADPFELAIRAVVGQQISVARASAACGVITVDHGDTLPDHVSVDERLTHLFPTAEALAAADPATLKMPRARGSAITGFSAAVAEGDIDLSADDLRERLLALPGFGPWTVGYICMRGLGSRDILLDGDLIIRRSAESLGMPGRPRELAAYAERLAPWRSYLNMHLWAAYHPPDASRPRSA